MMRLRNSVLSVSILVLGIIAVAGNVAAHKQGENSGLVVPTPGPVASQVAVAEPVPSLMPTPASPSPTPVVARHKLTPTLTPVATATPRPVENTVGLPSHDVVLTTPAAEDHQKKSGVNGRIFIDAGCPVVEIHVDGTPTPQCEMKPYQSTVTIINRDTATYIGEFTSNPQGHFKVDLAPGNYIIKENVDYIMRPMTSMQPVTFEVHEGEYTDVSVFYDSGIR